MTLRPILLAALPLTLAACGGNDDPAQGERKNAAGQVLGGTISDEMLPLDTVRSQSPPMSGAGDGDGGETPATDGATAPPRDSGEGPGEPPREPESPPAAAETPAE